LDQKNYKSVYKWFSAFLPRMIVWVLTKEGYRLWDNDYRPEFGGMERLTAMQPILELKPSVM
jgi:hypothetical protein